MTYTGALQTERVQKGTTTFTYGLLGMVSEVKAGTTTWFVRDEQGQLFAARRGGTSYYYLFDGQGNVVALVDSAGAVKNRYQYEPYGALVTSGTSETVDNAFQFGGAYDAYTDDETGLIHIGARYYDPALGRWTQQDLLAGNLMSPTTVNRYAYAGCSPTNDTDPSGLARAPDPVPGIDGLETTRASHAVRTRATRPALTPAASR